MIDQDRNSAKQAELAKIRKANQGGASTSPSQPTQQPSITPQVREKAKQVELDKIRKANQGRFNNQQNPVEQAKQQKIATSKDQVKEQISTTPTSPGGQLNQDLMDQAGISGVDQQFAQQSIDITNQKVANQTQRLGDRNIEITDSLNREQQELENFQEGRKERLEERADDLLALEDESASLKAARADQEYQNNLFRVEQEKRQYEFTMNRQKRTQEQSNLENETRLRRQLQTQLGGAFGIVGLERVLEQSRRGDQLVNDLVAQTAIGKAEFAQMAIDIEKEYTNSVNEIEFERKAGKTAILDDLQSRIDDIDSEILTSRADKEEQARNLILDTYEQLNALDEEQATKLESVNEWLQGKSDEAKEEKARRETFDPTQSAALGYYANQFGEPIGVAEGQPPKPYSAGFDGTMSKQLGYLADSRGVPILGDDGRKVKYQDFEAMNYQNALSKFKTGSYSNNDGSLLNGRLGVNGYIVGQLEHGKRYVRDYPEGLQCGEWINDDFLQPGGPRIASSAQSKMNLVRDYGFKAGQGQPQIGDVIVSDTHTQYAHVSIISGIKDDDTLIVSDANLIGKGVVRHGAEVPPEAWQNGGESSVGKIYGFARLPLKQEVLDAMPEYGTPSDGARNQISDILTDNFFSPESVESMLGSQSGREELQAFSQATGISGADIAAYARGELNQGAGVQEQVANDGMYNKFLKKATNELGLSGEDAKTFALDQIKASYKTMDQGQSAAYSAHSKMRLNEDILDSKKSLANSEEYADKVNLITKKIKNDGLTSELINRQIKDPDVRNLIMAEMRFIEGVLRKESGAAISANEYSSVGTQYFPRAGDDKSTLKQKKRMREAAIEGMYQQMGPSGQRIWNEGEWSQSPNSSGSTIAGSEPTELGMAQFEAAGGDVQQMIKNAVQGNFFQPVEDDELSKYAF